MIQIKSPREIEIMARGGEILAATVRLLERSVSPGITTADLDKIADEFIRSHPGATAAFKGLYNFPASICTSINQEIVHGIPSRKRVIEEGDIVSIDIGVKLDGYYTDSATTVAVGRIDAESKRLLEVTKSALAAGIEAATTENHLGDIGAAVQGVVEAAGFSVVRDLVGHRFRVRPGRELRQTEARRQASARTDDRDRADGQRREAGNADDARSMDGRERRWDALGAFRAHDRGDRERPADSYGAGE